MNHSSDNSDNGKTENVRMDYYQLTVVEKDELVRQMESATAALNAQKVKDSKNACEFVQKLFDNNDVCDLLIYLSRLPVFNKEFAEALKHNLDLLAACKKLKYFTNLTLGHNAILLKNLAEHMGSPIDGMQNQIDKLFEEKELADIRVKDYMKDQTFDNAKKYL